MHRKDILALLDASLDGLVIVVGVNPAIEVVQNIVITVVKQEGMAYPVTSGIASQRYVDWVDYDVLQMGQFRQHSD